MSLRAILGQHTLGVVGQVSASLPFLVITSILSRTVGLEKAGEFVVLVGLGATIYAAAQWGLRTYIVIDRFKTFPAEVYLSARLLAIAFAGIIFFLVTRLFKYEIELAFILIIFKTIDAVIDLEFAFLLVWRKTGEALQFFCFHQLFKFLVTVLSFVVIHVFSLDCIVFVLIVGSSVSLLAVCFSLYRYLSRYSVVALSVSVKPIFDLFLKSFWLAAATIACAFVTSAPRLSLKWFYSGESLGVIGTTLSVCTLFGMVFYTTWLRFLPKFNHSGNDFQVAVRFVLETVLFSVGLVLLSLMALPFVVSFVFDFSYLAHSEVVKSVLVAGVCFSSGMNIANLYKVTRVQWMEIVCYLCVVVFVILVLFSVVPLSSVSMLLAGAGSIMCLVGLGSFLFLRDVPSRVKVKVGKTEIC